MPCACASCTIYPDGRTLLEAFAQAEPGQFDAILMDVQMPAINGLDATREIRRGKNPLGRTIPIIAMTANAFSSDKQACLDAGMNAHVVPTKQPPPPRNQHATNLQPATLPSWPTCQLAPLVSLSTRRLAHLLAYPLATCQNPLQHARHANPPQAKRPIKPS